MYGALKSSTRMWTPPASMTTSSARRWSSKAMPYCIPEQPPPLTKMRRASWGLSSLASSSLRRDWASGVSETTACSITDKMLPRDLSFTSPLAGEVGGKAAGWGGPNRQLPLAEEVGGNAAGWGGWNRQLPLAEEVGGKAAGWGASNRQLHLPARRGNQLARVARPGPACPAGRRQSRRVGRIEPAASPRRGVGGKAAGWEGSNRQLYLPACRGGRRQSRRVGRIEPGSFTS